MTRAAATGGRYLYAIVSGPGERQYEFAGINGAPVYTISNGKVAAVVSDIPNDKIRPERTAMSTSSSGAPSRRSTICSISSRVRITCGHEVELITTSASRTWAHPDRLVQLNQMDRRFGLGPVYYRDLEDWRVRARLSKRPLRTGIPARTFSTWRIRSESKPSGPSEVSSTCWGSRR